MRTVTVTTFPGDPLARAADLLVVAVPEGPPSDHPPFAALDAALAGLPARLAQREGFTGRFETELALTPAGTGLPARVVLLGAGRTADFTPARRLALAARASRVAGPRACAATLVLGATDAAGLGLAATGARLGAYAFDRYRTREKDPVGPLDWALATAADVPGAEAALARAAVHAEAVAMARDLVNLPSGDLAPRALVAAARDAAAASGLEFEVLDRAALREAGAGLLLGVGAAGPEGPHLVRLSWRPEGAAGAPLALVGKGITFDSGGLQLKPRGSIEDMKSDMAGAATVLAVLQALPRLGIRVPVDGWLAVSDNLVGADAVRPGDILRSLSGRTVEIADTDAEGRLVLADALTLAARRGASLLVDVATLTGACVVALGEHAAGLFASDDALAGDLRAAGARAGEELWRMPMYDSLKPQLKSELADLKNVGERWGGAIQGALFLNEFAEGLPHAHLDVAGPAFLKKEHALGPRGGTGFAVRTLLEWLEAADLPPAPPANPAAGPD